MKLSRVHSAHDQIPDATRVGGARCRMTAQRILIAAWFCVGMAPLLLQIRSYLKFMTPHKITETLVEPAEEGETRQLAVLCPIEELYIAQVHWNVEAIRYHEIERGRLCHFIVPQYNIHGNYLLGPTKSQPSATTPSSCTNESFPLDYYFYHGSIGYYAFYEEAEGSYCALDKTAYVRVRGLGTYDSNGVNLIHDRGYDGYRKSYWYSICGGFWLLYRSILMRRCYISCQRYGRRCHLMGERICRRVAVVYVQENMRLTAHGATNYHRIVMLYLLIEGLMSDLFMLIAQEGILVKMQYVSLGYNLSGVLLLVFEMIETVGWLREKWRVFVKRLIFCYESSMLGELLSVIGLQHYITTLNRSSLRHSKQTALAVSYYVWSLVGHGIIVLGLIAFIVSIRALWATAYVRWKHRALAVLLAPCSVDTTLALRSKMSMLGGYHWDDGNLYYTAEMLKSFGLLKMVEEDGTECVVLRKLNWFEVPTNNLFVVGIVTAEGVEPCAERPCSGVVSFFVHDLGGASGHNEIRRSFFIRTQNKVSADPQALNVLPPSSS